MATPRTFRCEVRTPDGPVLTAEAVSAIVPMADGLLGILAGRAPLIGMLGAGALAVTMPGDQRQTFFVSGGFAHVGENGLSVLAEVCQMIEDLDSSAAATELEKARSLPTDTPANRQRRQDAIEAASARVRVVQAR